jgi:hypothetical protein
MAMEGSEGMMKGGCACGRVQYTSTSMPDKMSNCHCQTCRKLGGGPFLTFARLPTTSINWLGTPPDHWKCSDVAERGFCSACGSTLSMQYYCQIDCISLTASSIEKSKLPLRKASEHIFVKEKAPWFDLPDDGIERFEGMPPGFEAVMDKWLKERSTST